MATVETAGEGGQENRTRAVCAVSVCTKCRRCMFAVRPQCVTGVGLGHEGGG